jgi:hypothetical protein
VFPLVGGSTHTKQLQTIQKLKQTPAAPANCEFWHWHGILRFGYFGLWLWVIGLWVGYGRLIEVIEAHCSSYSALRTER